MNAPIKPKTFLDAHRQYLNALRESGDTNMFGARPYLMDKFPALSNSEANSVIGYWMKTFKVQP